MVEEGGMVAAGTDTVRAVVDFQHIGLYSRTGLRGSVPF